VNRFFVYHPVFAWVIAIFIALFGVIGLRMLPIEQYPQVAPPSLNLQLTYDGADAATLDRTVTSIIEKEISGVENFLYMSSTSRSNGTAQITVTFKPGTDLDVARSQVQDRLSRVEPRLPQEVRQRGVTVTKSSSGFLMLVALDSKGGALSELEMGNYASTKIMDELRRVQGVGDVRLFGSPYAMRIWLDEQKLAGYGITAAEALNAVQEQNSQTAGGGLGEQPVAAGAEFNAKIVTQDRFQTPEQFRQIIVRSNPDGSTIRLGDVAKVELGQDNYGFRLTLNGKATAGMAVELASGANALGTAEGIRARMHELEKTFPKDLSWSIPYDTTPFITASVDSVIRTLVEAMVLVFLVMFLFLQNWRATLIPAVVVPIALAGSCLGLYLFDYSINTLSLFAMVVAIGILVDDAIVVVENVERIMREEGLNPRRATVKAMGQITGAIVGITLVLVAVFIPMAFFPGSTGGIYRQFSVTLTISIFFSAVLALTLTPALCATLLKPHEEQEPREPQDGVRGMPARFFRWFNRHFERLTGDYAERVGTMLAAPKRWLAVFGTMCLVTLLLFFRLPGGFLPTEDQGYFFASYIAPPGATIQRTQEAVNEAEAFLRKQPEIRNIVTLVGFSFFGQGQSAAHTFIDLKPWEERKGAEHSASALVARANAAFQTVTGAQIFALDPPPILALGNATGFTMKIEDRGGEGGPALAVAAQQILAEASKSGTFATVRPEGLPPAPQLFVEIDRIKARALGLQIGEVNQTLGIAFGSVYANDFVHDGSVLRVYLQADAAQRMHPDDVLALRVRNGNGDMVPFSAFTRVKWTAGPQQLERYNGYPSITISGQAAPGKSSGAAIKEMERIADKVLTGNLAYEWTGTAFEEKQAGGQIGLLLGLSVVVVFLLLAGLYESWPIPLSVLLVVPFGVLGTVLFTMVRGLSADVYFNVGLITIIGLAAKNAILIVEFAIEQEAEGVPPREATVKAARLRLRPILMTSLAFILGMVPLAIASGAGAASRHAVGTGVMGGMIAATAFGIFFTPVFYLATRLWLTRKHDREAQDAREEAAELAGGDAQSDGGLPHA
jgi:multidrug efflux pump